MEIIKRNALPLIFACIVGLFCIAPALLAPHALGTSYQGYPFIYQANEDIYMARTHDVIDGHPLIGSPMLYEYKNTWPAILPVGENIDALPSVLFHIPLKDTIVAIKFIFPAILFLLIYTLALSMVSRPETFGARLAAIAAGLLVTLGYDFVDYTHLPALITSTQTHLLVWTRPVNPITGALLLFSLLIVVWKILTQKTKWLFVLGGILLGGTVCYFFSFAIGGAVVGLTLLYSLYSKNFTSALRLLGALAVGFILQIPYWYHSFISLSGSDGRAVALRNGALYGHTPIINKFLLAVSLVFFISFAYAWYRRKSLKIFEVWWWQCAILLLACWAAFNEQVITGVTVWPYHFVQYTIPISMFVLLILLNNYLIARFPVLLKILLVAIIAISLAMGASSALSYRYALTNFLERQNDMPVFAWINNNTPKDCVVLVDEPQENLSTLIPAFTDCNTYMSTYTPYNVPQDRILYNFLVLMRLRGVLPQDARAYLESHPGEVNGYLYNSIDQSLFTGTNAETQANIETLVPAYQDFYKTNFTTALKKYRIDYFLMVGPNPLPSGITLKKEMQSGLLTLYKVQ